MLNDSVKYMIQSQGNEMQRHHDVHPAETSVLAVVRFDVLLSCSHYISSAHP